MMATGNGISGEQMINLAGYKQLIRSIRSRLKPKHPGIRQTWEIGGLLNAYGERHDAPDKRIFRTHLYEAVNKNLGKDHRHVDFFNKAGKLAEQWTTQEIIRLAAMGLDVKRAWILGQVTGAGRGDLLKRLRNERVSVNSLRVMVQAQLRRQNRSTAYQARALRQRIVLLCGNLKAALDIARGQPDVLSDKDVKSAIEKLRPAVGRKPPRK